MFYIYVHYTSVVIKLAYEFTRLACSNNIRMFGKHLNLHQNPFCIDKMCFENKNMVYALSLIHIRISGNAFKSIDLLFPKAPLPTYT